MAARTLAPEVITKMAILRRPRIARADGVESNVGAGGYSGGPAVQAPAPEESPVAGLEGPLDGPMQPEAPPPIEGGGRGSESPRSRYPPPSPREPTPHAGTTINGPIGGGPAGGGGGGPLGGPGGGSPVPFSPLGGGPKGLFGRNRGLQGGGLGLMSPSTSMAENQSIEDLIQQLIGGSGKKMGGRF